MAPTSWLDSLGVRASRSPKGKLVVSQKIKAPNQKGGHGFLWTIIAILVIAAVVIGIIATRGASNDDVASNMPQEEVNFEVEAKDNVIEVASKDVAKDTPVVDIYEDFSCPHCADLVEADHEDSTKALNDGKVKIHFHFLNFLDDGKDGPSTRGAAVAYAVAESGNAKAFWNMHNHMMLDQQTVARTWDYEQFGDAASAYDLDSDLVDKISNGEVKDQGKEISKANGEQLQRKIGQISSPVLFVDGKQYEVKSGPGGKPASWVPDVVKDL